MSFELFAVGFVSFTAAMQFYGTPTKRGMVAVMLIGVALGMWFVRNGVQHRLDKLDAFEKELAERVQARWSRSE